MLADGERDAASVFGAVAEAYHRLRPRYPEALITTIANACGDSGRRALELGAGTGIATRAMLDHGFEVTAVEPDPALAGVLQRELADCSGLHIEIARFEDWPVPDEPYDLVYSATAFHWIDRRVREPKAAAVLRPGGHLAIFSYRHVAGGDRAFFGRIQRCYADHMPGADRDAHLAEADEVPVVTRGLRAGGLFEAPIVSRWTAETRHNRDDYLDLLDTYSGHRWLQDDARAALFACIGDEIDALPGGMVHKAYLHELILLKRTDVPVVPAMRSPVD